MFMRRFLTSRFTWVLALPLLFCTASAPAQTAPVITSFQRLENGTILVWFNGTPGELYRVIAATTPGSWDTVAYQFADPSFGDFGFSDPSTAFYPRRFYSASTAQGDVAFPVINITSPLPDELVGDPSVLLQGTVTDNTGVREVRVNDAPIAGTTSFSAQLNLVPGTNRFLISAIDLSSNRNRRSQVLQVRYLPAAPFILSSPSTVGTFVGSNALFSAQAGGSGTLVYQWLKDGLPLADGPRLAGATTPALSVSNVSGIDIGGYSLVVTNASGRATSDVAMLLVDAPPGFVGVFGTSYAENFDSMGSTGTNTPPGWFVGTGTGAISGTNVTVSTGSSSGSGNYNFGSTTNNDRALGSLAASSTQRDSEVRFINGTGSNIVSLAITYTGEQWRQGGTSATNNDLTLQFSTNGSTFTAVGAAFDFSSPFDTGTAGALDGNAATNRVTGIGGDFIPANPIPSGGTFYLRWADIDNPSNDHGLAIDDFTITFTLAPP